ncbi:MAG: LysM peptidoglycan-binding domain-containing protein [Prolixibacteraceae bacterium]|nr:LysM peptidoglycan-binding domain-containing protein [Prolixibacteraceae bacterium]
MRIFLIVSFLVFLQLVSPVFGQQNRSVNEARVEGQKYILHKVEKGETIYSISNIYNIEQKDLVAANSQLIFGLKEGDSLKIPKHDASALANNDQTSSVVDVKFIFHRVKTGETVYSISKQYGVGVDAIYRFNPESRNELLENEILRIPDQKVLVKADGLLREDDNYFYHNVQPGETIYALSRRYETTVNNILAANPNIEETLKTGELVKVPKKTSAKNETDEAIASGEYFFHTVESGDTFFSFKRRFGIDKNELIALNPQLNDGLNVGLVLKIPSKNIPNIEVIPFNDNDFNKHKVKGGETLFGISQYYNVGIIDIKEVNPELKNRGLIAGEELLIPKKIETEKEVGYKEDKDLQKEEQKTLSENINRLPEVLFETKSERPDFDVLPLKPFSSDTFNITMFLPLFFDLNEQYNLERKSNKELKRLDSLKHTDPYVLGKYFEIISNENGMAADTVLVDSMQVRKNRSLFPNSRYFVSYYQGFLLGLDSMQRAGAKVRLNLFDDQYNAQVVDSLLMHTDLLNSNLIIGPIDVRLQERISAFSAKNQIPLVSPLSSNSTLLNENPFYVQANPSKSYILKKTSDFISDAFFDKNIVVMTLGNEETLNEINLAKMLRDKLYSSSVYHNLGEVRYTQIDFTEGGHLGYWQLKRTLKPDIKNIIFIPATENRSEREALLSRAINSLYVLSEEFDITLVGLNDYPMFKSINTEYFHRLNMHYLTSYNIDYNSALVADFVGQYRNEFKTDPDFYSFCAYDIALYFMGAFQQFGKYYIDNIKDYSPNLTQSNFNFQRVDELSGFMNHALYIMNFSPTYTIDMIGKVNEGR